MSPAIELGLVFLIATLSYAQRVLWFLFKVFFAIGIGWGVLQSVSSFPLATFGRWQERLLSASLDFPGKEYLAWVANNWLEIAALAVLISTMRSRRILGVVAQTSGHAAYTASALANYLDVEPTTQRLLPIWRDKNGSFFAGMRAIAKEGLYGSVMSIFGGVPFLPDEAIPARKGQVVRYREDFQRYVSMAESDSANPDSMLRGTRSAAPMSSHDFGWDNDHKRQDAWVQVESWQYKVFVQSLRSPSALFQFEGVASGTSGLKGLRVEGEITIPFEALHSGQDESVSDGPGYFHFVDGKSGPYVKVTLLVAPEAFAELFRVFSTTYSSNNGALGLKLHLTHPKGSEKDFWRVRWQKEQIQIRDFGFYSGGRFKRISSVTQ